MLPSTHRGGRSEIRRPPSPDRRLVLLSHPRNWQGGIPQETCPRQETRPGAICCASKRSAVPDQVPRRAIELVDRRRALSAVGHHGARRRAGTGGDLQAHTRGAGSRQGPRGDTAALRRADNGGAPLRADGAVAVSRRSSQLSLDLALRVRPAGAFHRWSASVPGQSSRSPRALEIRAFTLSACSIVS